MKAVVLDATLSETSAAKTLRDLMTERQIESSWFTLRNLKMISCRSCGACGTRMPGQCWQKDDMPPVIRSIAGSDLLVYLTPIKYGGYSSLMQKAIERTIPLGETVYFTGTGSHPMLYGKKYLLAIGLSEVNYNEADNFRLQVARNARNFQSPYTTLVMKPSDNTDSCVRSIDRALGEAVEIEKCSGIMIQE